MNNSIHSFSHIPIEPVYHVLIPNQPSVSRNGHGILKFKLPSAIMVISPSQSSILMEVPLTDIRRIGCMHTHNSDLVWFETCQSCKNSQSPNQFLFALVPSGTATAQALTREVKIAIERATGVFLILEETNQSDMTFVSRSHYGCPCFPLLSRNRILIGGLNECLDRRLINVHRSSEPILHVGGMADQQCRRPSDSLSNMGLSLEEYVTQPHRRGTISSCSPTTPNPPRHMLSRGPTSLDRLRQTSISSMTSQNSTDIIEEVHTPLSDAVFDIPPPPMGYKRNLTHKDSFSSSHGGSGGSLGSDILEHEEPPPDLPPMRRLSQSRPDINRPNIPPRSAASLRLKAMTPTAV